MDDLERDITMAEVVEGLGEIYVRIGKLLQGASTTMTPDELIKAAGLAREATSKLLTVAIASIK